jgi:calcineurin-like phosphoesterase
VVVNGENAAGGYGITATIANEFFAAGVDVITMGNHVWDQRELVGHIDREPRIVRPLNLPPGTPGRGLAEVTTARGQKLVVAQVLGRLFMGLADDPFRALDQELSGTCWAAPRRRSWSTSTPRPRARRWRWATS